MKKIANIAIYQSGSKTVVLFSKYLLQWPTERSWLQLLDPFAVFSVAKSAIGLIQTNKAKLSFQACAGGKIVIFFSPFYKMFRHICIWNISCDKNPGSLISTNRDCFERFSGVLKGVVVSPDESQADLRGPVQRNYPRGVIDYATKTELKR